MRSKTQSSSSGARCIAMAVCATLLGAAGARSQVPTSDIVTMLPSPQGALGGTFYPESISSSGLITGYYGSSGHNGTRYRTVIANVAGGSVVVEDAGYQGGNLDPNDANYNGEESWGFGINAGGAGTGSSYQGAASISYFSGYPIDGLSNGPNPPPGTSPRDVEMGTAINNSGMVTGVAEQVDSSGNTNVHAVVFQNGTWTDLGANLPYISGAYGVSTTGTVVGFQTTTGQYANVLLAANQGKVATEWNQSANGTWAATSLGTLPGAAAGAQSMAFGVNTEGQVVGVSDNANGGDDATLWQPNGSGGFTAINLNPVVSGKTGSSGTLANPVLQPGGILSPAFMQDNPLTNVLGTNVSSCAESINNLGQVVGFTYAGNYGRQAFLATVSGTTATMVTLNSLLPANMQQANGGPWDLEEATSINDLGQIVGWGSYDSPTNGYENVGFEFTLSQQSAWANSSGDYWENTSNWTGSVPNAPCATAIFSDAQGLTAPGTIIMQYDKTVGHLTFNSVNSYTISSPTGARLIIDDTNDISGTTPSIIVAAGSHTINVPVVLATNNGSGGLAINTFPGTTLTLNSSVTAGNTTANPLTLTPITLTGAGSVVVSQTGSIGVPLILDNASITFGARVNFNQSGGNGILVRNVPSITFPNQVGDPNSTDTYTVGEGSEAQLTLALASSSTSRQVLVTSALNFYSVNTDPTDPTNSAALAGKIDLGNNDMIVLNGNIANINQALKEGYNAGAQSAQAPYPNTNWTGSGLDQGFQQDGIGVDDGNSLVAGILSSAAAADTTHLTALGGIQNVNAAGKAIYAIFDTVSVSSSDVLVKYTYYGDANLDGQVDGSDYSLIDYAYTYNQKNPSATLTGWYNGDFNYDGVTDGSDYTLIDNAFNQQGAAINAAIATVTAQIGGVSTSAVPEPAALGALAMAAARLLGRRSRGVASKAF